MSKSWMSGKLFGLTILAGALAALWLGSARAETVLSVAMTASDIPDWAGMPDQGYEGLRFVGYSLYDGLINWDLSRSDKEVSIKPGLATEWHVDPINKKRWIFKLRHNVKFHDGCVWNAEAAVWNFQKLIDKRNPAFSPVYFARARPRTSDIASIEKVSDDTIAFNTVSVNSLFPYNLPYVVMVSKCAVEAAGNNYALYAKKPAGTGPYIFSKVVPHERLELVRNPNYWDPNRIPKHDRLVLLPMPEATTRAAALMSGQVNFIEAPSPDMIPELRGAGMQVITNVYPHLWPYVVNMLHGPFTDIRVRQAANYAIDRQAVVDLLDGIAKPAYGLYIPTQRNYGKITEYKTDVAKATELLKAAKCYPCEIRVAISPAGSGQMQPQPMNELVKSQLEAAGFKVDFDVIDWNTMVDVWIKGAVASQKYDAINFSSSALEPLNLLKATLKRYQSPNGANWGGLNDPKINSLGDQIMTTFDPAKQDELLKLLHEQMVADAARVFIVSDINPRALAPNLSGFKEAQSWFQDLTPIVVK